MESYRKQGFIYKDYPIVYKGFINRATYFLITML